MRDPVLCADGHSYDRTAITAWIAQHGNSPLTHKPLKHQDLIPNHTLRSFISTSLGL